MRIALLLVSMILIGSICEGILAESPTDLRTVRLATYNVSLYRNQNGQLVQHLSAGNNRRARGIAEVIQRLRPDVILLNEFDYDADGTAIELFKMLYLQVGQNGQEPIRYGYHFNAAVNTGVPTGLDMDHDGKKGGPGDAFGFGRHQGQYGMVVFSKYPIDHEHVRTFQKFLWKDMPKALLPVNSQTGNSYYSEEELQIFRLSSKSHWAVPIRLGEETSAPVVHLLCSHPTPPVFDGPEDRNGHRNHDEIRLFADLIPDPSNPKRGDYLVDDKGQRGGLPADALFVVAGDLNSDPFDGASTNHAVRQLLEHPSVNATQTPQGKGGVLSAEQNARLNSSDSGNPAEDTADFSDDRHSNLRADYVLPSLGLFVVATGVYWPLPDEPGGDAITASDHRMVWIDIGVNPNDADE